MAEGLIAGTVFVDVLPNMALFTSRLAAGINGSGLRSQLSRFGTTMTRYVSLPLVAAGAESVKMAVTFQREMKLVQTQAGASAGEVKKMSAALLEMAQNSRYGPVELAQALYHLESIGYRGQKALDALKVAANGAAVGNANLEDTTSALGSVLVTHIKGTQNFSKAMGTLNAIIGAGNIRMDDLIGALKSGVVPVAKITGLSLRELGAAIATMSDAGVPAQLAATRLRTSLILVDKPSVAATKALKSVGLGATSLGDALRKPDGVVKMLELLKQHMSDIQDPTKRVAFLGTLFGGSRSAGAMALLLNNLNRIQNKYVEIGATAGNFNKDVLATQQTSAYKLAAAWANLQAAMVRVGTVLMPIATDFANVGADVANFVSGLSQVQLKVGIAFLGMLAAIGPVVSIGLKLYSTFNLVGSGILKLIGLLPGLTVSLEAADGAIIAFGEDAAVMTPGGIVLVGLAAVATAALLVGGALFGASSETDNLARSQQAALGAVKGLSNALNGQTTAANNLKDANLAVAGDHLAIEEAQKGVAQALKTGGKNSLAYQNALLNLHRAQQQLVEDQFRQKDAVTANDRALTKANVTLHKAASGLKGLTADGKAHIINLNALAKGTRQYSQAVQDNNGTVNNYIKDAKNQAAADHNAYEQLKLKYPAIADNIKQLGQQASAAAKLAGIINGIPTSREVNLFVKAQVTETLTARQKVVTYHETYGGPSAGSGGPAPSGSHNPHGKAAGATGAIVTQPTWSLIGEAGPEALIPLNQMPGAFPLGGGNGQVEMVITNWHKGTGYIRSIADGSVSDHAKLNRQIARMGR